MWLVSTKINIEIFGAEEFGYSQTKLTNIDMIANQFLLKLDVYVQISHQSTCNLESLWAHLPLEKKFPCRRST